MVLAIVGIAPNLCHTNACAGLVSFAYEGVIEQTEGGAEFDAFLGQAFRFEYTFETTTADDEPDPSRGFYSDPAGMLTVTVGANTYSSTGVGIFVADDLVDEAGTRDGYSVFDLGSLAGPPIAGYPPNFASLVLRDTTFSIFDDDSLPTIQPDPASFSDNSFSIGFLSDDGQLGRLRSGTISRVPEPSLLAMFGLAALALVGRRRHGSSSSRHR